MKLEFLHIAFKIKNTLYFLLYVIFPTQGLNLACGSACKEYSCNVGDLGSIPGLGISPGEGKGYHSSILARRIPWAV